MTSLDYLYNTENASLCLGAFLFPYFKFNMWERLCPFAESYQNDNNKS